MHCHTIVSVLMRCTLHKPICRRRRTRRTDGATEQVCGGKKGKTIKWGKKRDSQCPAFCQSNLVHPSTALHLTNPFRCIQMHICWYVYAFHSFHHPLHVPRFRNSFQIQQIVDQQQQQQNLENMTSTSTLSFGFCDSQIWWIEMKLLSRIAVYGARVQKATKIDSTGANWMCRIRSRYYIVPFRMLFH